MAGLLRDSVLINEYSTIKDLGKTGPVKKTVQRGAGYAAFVMTYPGILVS
jgi:hypothetical protein